MLSSTTDQLVLSEPLGADLYTSSDAYKGATGSQIAMRVSLQQPEEMICVPLASSAVFVRTDTRAAEVSFVRQPDETIAGKMQGQGSVLSLGGGKFTLASPPSRSEFVRFDVPTSSFQSFCKARGYQIRHQFQIPQGSSDSTLHLLARTIRPLLSDTSSMSPTFETYFVMSFFSHLAASYGMELLHTRTAMGGLSPRNRSLVDHLLRHSPALEISVDSMAAECRLSSRHFARAFLQTFGIPFHRVQKDLRLDLAKRLLTSTQLSLREIATHMGYADQATFTESFKRDAGAPPGRYRRQHWSQDSAYQRDRIRPGCQDSVMPPLP